MAQDNTPNFIRPGMTQDADPANQSHNQAGDKKTAFADKDPVIQAPDQTPEARAHAIAQERKRAVNPLQEELTKIDADVDHTEERLHPGNSGGTV